jgi:hypothetical protein
LPDELPVHVLSVRQPWAHAIIYLGKDVENRTWKPDRPCRVLIHASRRIAFDRRGLNALAAMRPRLRNLPLDLDDYSYGQIIGRVDVVSWDRIQGRGRPWSVDGQWHWHLTNVVPIQRPIEMKGRPSFFPAPDGWELAFDR